MPRAIDPSYRFSVVLDSDADKPEATRPTFWFRAATAREWRALVACDEITSITEQQIEIATRLHDTLVDWRLDGKPYSESVVLDDVLGPDELGEMFRKVAMQGKVSSAEKKPSDSPPSSNGDTFAEPVLSSASTLQATESLP